MKVSFSVGVLFVLALYVISIPRLSASPPGTEFSYQGRLTDGTNVANGSYDFSSAVFDADSGGVQLGGTVTNNAVVVSNGSFTLPLDFGDVFSGADRWLEIAVKTNDAPVFATLSPRQKITATPYSITAGNLLGTLSASQLSGTVPLALLPGAVVTNNQSGVNLTGTFSGYGTFLAVDFMTASMGQRTRIRLDTNTIIASGPSLWAGRYVRTNLGDQDFYRFSSSLWMTNTGTNILLHTALPGQYLTNTVYVALNGWKRLSNGTETNLTTSYDAFVDLTGMNISNGMFYGSTFTDGSNTQANVALSGTFKLPYTPDGSLSFPLPISGTNSPNSGVWIPTIGTIGFVSGGQETMRIDPVGIKSYGLEKTPGRFYEQTNFHIGFGLYGTPNVAVNNALYVDNRFLILGDLVQSTNGIVTGGIGRGQVLVMTNANATASLPDWRLAQVLLSTNTVAYRYAYTADFDETNLLVTEINFPNITPITTSGRVWCYWLSNGQYFHYQQILTLTGAVGTVTGNDEFGHAIAVRGTNLAIGGLDIDYIAGGVTNYNSGVVSFFHKEAGHWTNTQPPYVTSEVTSNSSFGDTIALDETGTNCFVHMATPPLYRDKVIWLQKWDGIWTNVNTITNSPQRDNFSFGFGHMAAWNGRLVVGASAISSSVLTGAVYFFTYSGTNFTQRYVHDPTDTGPYGRTRYALVGITMRGDLATAGGMHLDGLGQLSANLQYTNGMGKVHVFRWNGNDVHLADVLAPPTRTFGHKFGGQVWTDATNIYAVSIGAYEPGTNYMVFYSFTNCAAITNDSGVFFGRTNAVDAWPPGASTPGGFALVNSNGIPFFILSSPGSTNWTATNRADTP